MPDILLADDHTVLRTGLKNYIKTILPQVDIKEVADGDSVIAAITDFDYDLVVLDIQMNNVSSVGLITEMLAIKPQLKILMYSVSPEEIYAKRFLQLGALGYLSKGSSLDEMSKAINNVLNNKRYLSPSVTNALAATALGKYPDMPNPFKKLSSRELEITKHLIRGESVSQISGKLGIHTSTVGTYKARILDKLGCQNVMQIFELAEIYST